LKRYWTAQHLIETSEKKQADSKRSYTNVKQTKKMTIDITPKIVRFDRYGFRSVASTVEKAEHMCRVKEKAYARILQQQKEERERERKIQADKEVKMKVDEEAKIKEVEEKIEKKVNVEAKKESRRRSKIKSR